MEKQVNKKTVQRLLINLGIAPKTNGYGYLTSAISIELERRPGDVPMGKLCEMIATEYHVSPSSVERCMRFAIGRAYNRNKLAGINDLFDAYIITDVPMLSDFIMYIAEYLYTFYKYDDYRIG